MRIRELLQEDYQQSLISDLQNLLVGALGSGASEIRTTDLVDQMSGMGYSVSPNSLIALLSQMPMVTNVTPQMINLIEPEGDIMQDGEDSAEQVKAMARHASENTGNSLGS